MPFLWLGVNDAPTSSSDRGVIETEAFSLLTNIDRERVDPTPPTWLGRISDRQTIARSGLWNVNHVGNHPNTHFLKVMRTWLREFET
jgi:hypothetical protein